MNAKQRSVAAFKERLGGLGYATYSQYLRGPHWADVKARFRSSRLCKRRCFACGDSSDRLSLHHRTYKRIGAERLSDLIEVCQACHEQIHKHQDSDGAPLWGATSKVVRKTRKGIWQKI